MRILFIGDIVGRPGRELVRRGLPALVEYHGIDLVIANAENAAAGFGLTREIGEQLLDYGVDVMTSGNHIWDKKEALEYIGGEPRLLRPANYPAGVPGRGSYVAQTRDGRSVGACRDRQADRAACGRSRFVLSRKGSGGHGRAARAARAAQDHRRRGPFLRWTRAGNHRGPGRRARDALASRQLLQPFTLIALNRPQRPRRCGARIG